MALVRMFEANHQLLLKAEVDRTDQMDTLFRRNSMTSKLLATHSRLVLAGHGVRCSVELVPGSLHHHRPVRQAVGSQHRQRRQPMAER